MEREIRSFKILFELYFRWRKITSMEDYDLEPDAS